MIPRHPGFRVAFQNTIYMQRLIIPSRAYPLRRRPDAEERIQGRLECLLDRRVGGREGDCGRRHAQGRDSLATEACSRDLQPCPEAQEEVPLPSRRNRPGK